MRRPLRGARTSTRASAASFPAPVGGWNRRDALADMRPEYALELRNYIPRENSVELRKGSEIHAQGMNGAVETLFAYRGEASEKLLAAADGSIWDVTSTGVVTSTLADSYTSDRWQYVNFRGYLIAVNGGDAPAKYDGASWTANSITGSGLTASDLIHVCAHRSRLFFVEKNTASYWYLATNNISGTASEVVLTGLAPRGGHLVAIGSWSRDGGAGMDDLAVFVMSSGDTLVYSGGDPGDANDWNLIGVFSLGEPIGRRCLLQLGGDLVVITRDGYVSLESVVASGRVGKQTILSDAINQAVRAVMVTESGSFGHDAIYYPGGGYVLFNAPTASWKFEQYLFNVNTGAWARFTDMNATCWALHDGELYFGTGLDYANAYLWDVSQWDVSYWSTAGTIRKADTGKSDSGANIVGQIKTAFSTFRTPVLKRLTLVRPLIQATSGISYKVGANVEYGDQNTVYATGATLPTGATWDVALWDVSYWTSGVQITNAWKSLSTIGTATALRFETETNTQDIVFHGFEVQFERGFGL